MNRYEPPIVGHLRRLVAQQASEAQLIRIAGSVGEFNRLAGLYDLGRAPASNAVRPTVDECQPAPALPDPPRDRRSDEPLPARQALLLGMLTHLAQIGEQFPESRCLGEALECSWLVVERDLRALSKRRLIKIETLHTDERVPWRRVSICGTLLATAPPAGKDVAYRHSGAGV